MWICRTLEYLVEYLRKKKKNPVVSVNVYINSPCSYKGERSSWCKRHRVPRAPPVYTLLRNVPNLQESATVVLLSLSQSGRDLSRTPTFLTSGKVNRTGSARATLEIVQRCVLRCRRAKLRFGDFEYDKLIVTRLCTARIYVRQRRITVNIIPPRRMPKFRTYR